MKKKKNNHKNKNKNKKNRIIEVNPRDWLISLTLLIGSFSFIITFLIVSVNLQRSNPPSAEQIALLVLIIIASILFFIFFTWSAYLKLYKNLWNKIENHSTILLKILHFTLKYITFGWWITRKYDYELAIKSIHWENN